MASLWALHMAVIGVMMLYAFPMYVSAGLPPSSKRTSVMLTQSCRAWSWMTLVVFARVSVRSSPHPCRDRAGSTSTPYGTVTCGAQAGDHGGVFSAPTRTCRRRATAAAEMIIT